MSGSDDWSQPTEYERWYASPLGRAYAACIEQVLRPWLATLRPARALDVGCGPGLMEARLLPADCELFGLDCSEPAALRAAAVSRSLGQQVTILAGSVERLPLADATFPLVLSLNCLEFVADRQAAFAELARVLAPRGTLVLAVLHRHGWWELARRLRRPFNQRPYYQGRFFTRRQLINHCCDARLALAELTTAVHFPPSPLLPMGDSMARWDQLARRWHCPGGGVLLCRAVKN